MTKRAEQGVLSQLALPFIDKARIVAYVDYSREIQPIFDLTKQLVEPFASAAILTGDGGLGTIESDDVPVGTIELYNYITLSGVIAGAAEDFFLTIHTRNIEAGTAFMNICRVTINNGNHNTMISNTSGSTGARAMMAGPIILYPGQFLSINSVTALVLADVFAARFSGVRMVGPNDPTEDRSDALTVSS